ncbi:hypothetical protein TSUD_09770 [Trifolium subterraneum]|nr:hypothetical protein TSUD_09770 [Trifolium subterraneum]
MRSKLLTNVAPLGLGIALWIIFLLVVLLMITIWSIFPYAVVARLRGLSDHCSIVLFANEEDWGPRPSRMLKCWRDVPGYNLFVKDKWNSIQVDGWGDRLATLDQQGEEGTLSEAEIEELHRVTSDIHSLSRMNASISWQQSRSLWLKEGDDNSKYFHSVLAGRRRGNAISMIQADGITLEGVTPIRQAVFSHFASHFKTINLDRPRVDNLQFKRLNHLESGSLIKPFSEAEVRAAVWDCDNFKSPGLDGVNFGFIKDFSEEFRSDVMRFISEFIIAFVKDRQILDGILIANEAVDEARKYKKELMLFKVDFEKAYDSVDWGYLDDVMGSMSHYKKTFIYKQSLKLLIDGIFPQ